MDNTLMLLGLAKRAARLEVGEEPVGAAARAREARLIVVARDAAENTYRRVRHFADAGGTLWVSVPYTKEELGGAVGRTGCGLLRQACPGGSGEVCADGRASARAERENKKTRRRAADA